MSLPALSIRQPWAWAITTLGKDIENRTWWRDFRGPFLIHTGKGLKGEDVDDFVSCIRQSPELAARLAEAGGLDLPAIEAMTGGIVGSAEITDCITERDPRARSPWFFGPYGFTLANARPLPFQPCRGQLGFFMPAIGTSSPPAAEPPPPAQTRLPL